MVCEKCTNSQSKGYEISSKTALNRNKLEKIAMGIDRWLLGSGEIFW